MHEIARQHPDWRQLRVDLSCSGRSDYYGTTTVAVLAAEP